MFERPLNLSRYLDVVFAGSATHEFSIAFSWRILFSRYASYPDLEGGVAGAVNQKVDTSVEDHEQSGHGVDFVEEEARDVLHFTLDAADDEGGGEYLVCTGSNPEIAVKLYTCTVHCCRLNRIASAACRLSAGGNTGCLLVDWVGLT